MSLKLPEVQKYCLLGLRGSKPVNVTEQVQAEALEAK